MAVTVDELRAVANRLRDAIEVYHQFVDGWPYETESVPSEVSTYLAAGGRASCDSPRDAGLTLAADVEENYYRVREVEATYLEQSRARARTDWSRIVEETEPAREAARRVHEAGYTITSDATNAGYVLPRDLAPAHRVSMNSGATPVVYEDRVAQYRAVAKWIDVTPEDVYHPGSGHDVSLSRAFPDSRVVYVDVDAAAMTDLRQAGYEANAADATGYEVENGTDLLVFRNAGLFEEAIVAANLQPGGWILANNHLESARHVSQLDGVELAAVVPADWTGDSPRVDEVESASPRSASEPPQHHEGRSDGRSRDIASSTGYAPAALEDGSPLDLYVFQFDP